MIHNTTDFWRYLHGLSPDDPDRVSARVCRLLDRTFQRWNDPPRWLTENQVGHLFEYKPDAKSKSVASRRGMAIRKMLNLVSREPVASQVGTLEIHPDKMIVGSMPPFSDCQGKELVGHLRRGEAFDGEDETLSGWLNFLNDHSAFGHIVPCHARVHENRSAVSRRVVLKLFQRCVEIRSHMGHRSAKCARLPRCRFGRFR